VRVKYLMMTKEKMGEKKRKVRLKSEREDLSFIESKRQKRNGAKVGFGSRRDRQGVAKTKGLGAKRRETQKERHKLGNRANMCKRNGGICLIVEV